MELRDLRYFSHIASSGHLGRSAEELRLTQPALTKSVARLERELNVKLFDRTAKGMVLTAAGAQLQRHAMRLQVATEEAVRELTDMATGTAGHVTVGTGLVMTDHLLAAACTQLVEKYPRVTVDISTGVSEGLISALRDGKFDLVLSGLPAVPEPDLCYEEISQDSVVVVARKGHRLHSVRKVELETLLQERWALPKSGSTLSNWLFSRFRAASSPVPTPSITADSFSTLLAIVASTNLLTFQSTSAIGSSPWRHQLSLLRSGPLVWKRRIGVTYTRERYLPTAAKTLVSLLRVVAAAVPP